MNFSKCQIILWLHHGLHEHKDIFKVCSFLVFIEFHLNELLNNSCLFIFTHCKDNYHDLAAFYEEKKELKKYHTGQFGKQFHNRTAFILHDHVCLFVKINKLFKVIGVRKFALHRSRKKKNKSGIHGIFSLSPVLNFTCTLRISF